MKLFAFGSNGSGQLAIGHTEDVSTPTKCLFTSPAPNDKITKIAAGGNHTLLLTESGHVYAAGCNEDGRCGVLQGQQDENEHYSIGENILAFRRVVLTDPDTADVVDTFSCISATWEGSILVPITRDRVLVLGSSPKGELGLGEERTVTKTGVMIPDFPPVGTKIVSLASGMGHSVAVLSTGEVYGWGGSRKGQLGESLKEGKIAWSPGKVEGVPFCVTDVVCGREFTVLIGEKSLGEFVVLGDKANRWGIMDIPDSLQGREGGRKEIFDVGASWHGIYVHVPGSELNDSSNSTDPRSTVAAGSLVAWGRNDRGQLPPPGFPSPVEIGVGSEHVLALLENGSVATFGWGEHGNCGPDTDSRGNVAGKYNLISLPDEDRPDRRVVRVGGGCATSWLIVE